MTDNLIDLESRRKKKTQNSGDKPEMSKDDEFAYLEFKEVLSGLYGEAEISDKELDSLAKLALFFSKRLKSLMTKVHKAAKDSPEFGFMMAVTLTDLAFDEFLRIGLCGAIDEDIFKTAIKKISNDFSDIDFFEAFIEEEDYLFEGEDDDGKEH